MKTESIASLELAGTRVARGPKSVAMHGRAGGDIVMRVRVTNSGETRLAIDPDAVVTLRRPDALARSIKGAFKGGQGDLAARLIALGKRLERETAAEASVSYKADFEYLEPGETAQVEIHMHLSESAGARNEWRARVPLLGSQLDAEIKLTGAKG